MGQLLIKDKDIVTPGEELAKGMDYLPGEGTYRLDDFVRANKFGLVTINGRAIKIIPLSGAYLPKSGDVIVGDVIDVSMNGWRIDTKSAYSAMLMLKEATSGYIEKGADLTKYFDIGDYIMAKITNVTSQNLVDLTLRGPGLRKLVGGRIIRVNAHKVPRIIGKQGSMVSMIKEATGCNISVGQNGVVWIQGEPKNEIIAIEAIKMIESESHVSGLTDRVKASLDKSLKSSK
ncbi:MAG: exosome complex RNA-binding protein Rrp4 [Candidatus Woesearchaeota archaeon]